MVVRFQHLRKINFLILKLVLLENVMMLLGLLSIHQMLNQDPDGILTNMAFFELEEESCVHQDDAEVGGLASFVLTEEVENPKIIQHRSFVL